MTTFELNERLVEMPTDWKEITLEKYVEIARLDDLRRNTTIQELYILKLIEVLCDLRDNEGDDLEISKVSELVELLSFLHVEPIWDVLRPI